MLQTKVEYCKQISMVLGLFSSTPPSAPTTEDTGLKHMALRVLTFTLAPLTLGCS